MKKRLIVFVVIVAITTVVMLILADMEIENSTENRVFDDLTLVPHNRVALLLGASKNRPSGNPNIFFQNRINATVELFNAGKIDYIVISGDNSRDNYNEPKDMKIALIEQGISQERIYLDYAGFRTYDSVIRINKIFGQTKFTIISQEFHNRRAIYIAQYHGLDAVGFNAADVTGYGGLKTNIREMFARVKVFWDLLFNVKPKFLGEPIEIGV